MASNPPSACCVSGCKHDGTAIGRVKNIDGVNTYIVYPKDNQTPEKAIIFLTDAFGIYTNTQLLADDFANKGYLIVMPDLFRGDQLSVTDMHSSNVDFSNWLPKHQISQIDPIMEKTIKYARETLGIKRVGAVGYCLGAKYVCRFLRQNKIDVGYVAHPSFVTHEELGTITGPLTISAAEIDEMFTSKQRHESEGILANIDQPWQISLYSGVNHGFAIRADLSDTSQKFAKEQAFCQAVTWFNQYL